MTAVFGWLNNVKTGALTATSAEPSLPVTNLAVDQGDTASSWQTLAGVTAATLIVTGSTWQAFGLFRTNLTPAASIRWRAGSYDVTGPLVQVATAPITATTAQLDISDPTNPDGFLNVALCFAGSIWQPAIGISYASTYGRDESTDEVVSRGGQEFPVNRWRRRRWAVDMQGIRTSEQWASADALDNFARLGGNVLFVPDSQSPTLQQEAIFGRLKPTADFGFPAAWANARSWKATITERL